MDQELDGYLERLIEGAVPDSLMELDDSQQEDLMALIDKVLEKERAGMDGLFQSMTHTMKYIPSFLLQALTKKFIEPPIAARVCERLELKQSVSVAKGLSPEYVAQTALYFEPELGLALLEALPGKLQKGVVTILLEEQPLVLLDMSHAGQLTFLSKKEIRLLKVSLEDATLSRHRAGLLSNID